MPLILVLNSANFSIDEEKLTEVRSIAEGYSVQSAKQKEASPEQIAEAEIILGLPGSDAIKAAKKLKWLQLLSAGADRFVDKDMYCNKDVILTNSSGVFGLPISEHILAMIFAHNRSLMLAFQRKNEHNWEKGFPVKEFCGSTVGVIGLGDIGTEVAKRSKAFGARVVAVKRTPSDRPDYVDELYAEEGIDRLIEQSDYVVLALPSTGKTRGIMTAERISKMKSDAFMVNVGRGSLIDQEALITALKENRIGGAGLDVTSPEPLPAESPLWTLPNVIITPHVSGNSPGNAERRLKIFKENLRLYLSGRPMNNLVDFEKGY